MYERKSRMTIRQQNRLLEHFVAGTTARAVAELVGVQRTTAIKFYHRLRQLIASKLPSYELSGEVEADESYFGGRRKGQRALGWMTKARVSADLATRFLFFFTSLEALLTSSEKDAPITDTISRSVATIIAEKDKRYLVYQRLKKLYAIRSQLVHSESREVSDSQCEQLQYYVELMPVGCTERAA